MTEPFTGLLQGYRALDLTNEIGFRCGKLLGALGVDTIKVERPSGDPSRMIPPFVGGIPDPEKSLYWWAFNTDKRGITLNLESVKGQDLFRRLAARADFVIESFTPGFLDSLGLGYKALSEINPRIILTSITPFGQKGPYSRYKGSELIASAMSGVMAGTGDTDRAPLREGPDSVCFLANAAAAAGSVVAHYHRESAGQGQQVDVSLQHASALRGMPDLSAWEFDRRLITRMGRLRDFGAKPIIWIYPCKDGYVTWWFMTGAIAAPGDRALCQWMEDRGMANNPLREIDNWEELDTALMSIEQLDRLQAAIGDFFLTLTKQEIAEEGRSRGVTATVIANVAEVIDNPQLRARDYWTELEHPGLGTKIKYPRHFFLATETSNYVSRRAPLVGEHNDEIYGQELGLSSEEILALEAENVI